MEPQPPAAPATPAKKRSPWVWILGGCLVLMVIAGALLVAGTFFVAKKAKSTLEEFAENPVRKSVETMVRLNPDLDLVSTDDQAETITIRNNKTGEVATFDWSEIQNGQFRFESDGREINVDGSDLASGRLEVKDGDGNSVMSFGGDAAAPSWFPPYPGATEVVGLINANQSGQVTKVWTFKTSDPVGKVVAFYREQLEADEWQVEVTSSEGSGVTNGTVQASKDGDSESLNLVISKSGSEPSQAMVTYTGKGG